MFLSFRLFLHLLFFTSAAVAAARTRTTPRSLVHHLHQRQRQRQEEEMAYVDNANGKQYPVIATPNCTAFATREYLNRNDIPLPCREKQDDNGDSEAAVNSPPLFAPENGEGTGSTGGSTGSPTMDGSGAATSSPQLDAPNPESTNENRVRVTLFVGIRPFIPNIEPIVTAGTFVFHRRFSLFYFSSML